MTIAYLHLVRLHETSSSPSIEDFITLIHQHAVSYRYTPLITSRTRHWVARPKVTDASALNAEWHLLLLLQPHTSLPAPIPSSLSALAASTYTLRLAIPSRLLTDFPLTNASIRSKLMPEFSSSRLHELTLKRNTMRSSSQNLEASEELLKEAGEMMGSRTGEGSGPVTMLNLLRFNVGEPGRESYKAYGRAFGEDVGAKRGGVAKIVGKVIGEGGEGSGEGWDEVAVVHYPNIVAFCDMASAEDYQAANARWRLPALKDTLLLCTTEIPAERSASKL